MENVELKAIKRVLSEMKFLKERSFPTSKDFENYVIIVESLEKQIPKEIEIYDYGKAHCPVCKGDIHGIGRIKYCCYCGQRMNWDR